MAKKITIQHLYTTSGTTAPTGNESLGYGEIAISHLKGEEAIFIKPDENDNQIKFIPKHQIENLITTRLGEAGVATEGMISALTTNLENHINDDTANVSKLGHVKLVGGDLSGKTGNVINGEAAASHHTHGQYIAKDDISNGLETWKKTNDAKEMLRVKAALNGGINVDSYGVSINDVYQGKIASGVTAYDWGNHADAGYANNSDLTTLRNNVTAHTGNTTVHITGEERTNWNNAANRINTFLDVETGATAALDSLHEIQEYLTGSGNSVNTLLESLNNLTDTVSGNTNDITSLKAKFGENGEVTVLQNEVLRKVEVIDASDNLSATTGTTAIGNYKKYTITHTPASTENTTTTTANNEYSGLTFGGNFNIVNGITYDANGHVVSGSTQTLRLPNLPTASEEYSGIVKLRSGQLTLEDEFLNENKDYLTTAASVAHGHTEYVTYNDLNNYDGTTPLVISCGTY